MALELEAQEDAEHLPGTPANRAGIDTSRNPAHPSLQLPAQGARNPLPRPANGTLVQQPGQHGPGSTQPQSSLPSQAHTRSSDIGPEREDPEVEHPPHSCGRPAVELTTQARSRVTRQPSPTPNAGHSRSHRAPGLRTCPTNWTGGQAKQEPASRAPR